MTTAAAIGLDIGKQVFQVHGADRSGRAVLRRKLRRTEVAHFFSEQSPCLMGIEASGSAHYWARVLSGLGHTVRLMVPQFVKPYVKSQKNDTNDAEATCEAVTRPNMRFVPQKSVEQQDLHISGLLLSGGDLRSGHNGICASSPHQVIGLEWPCPRQVLKKLVSPVAPS